MIKGYWNLWVHDPALRLGFGVPYFNTFFLKGTLMKYKFILFSPWLLKSPVEYLYKSPAPPSKQGLFGIFYISLIGLQRVLLPNMSQRL